MVQDKIAYESGCGLYRYRERTEEAGDGKRFKADQKKELPTPYYM